MFSFRILGMNQVDTALRQWVIVVANTIIVTCELELSYHHSSDDYFLPTIDIRSGG